jgi:hypothetical protein
MTLSGSEELEQAKRQSFFDVSIQAAPCMPKIFSFNTSNCRCCTLPHRNFLASTAKNANGRQNNPSIHSSLQGMWLPSIYQTCQQDSWKRSVQRRQLIVSSYITYNIPTAQVWNAPKRVKSFINSCSDESLWLQQSNESGRSTSISIENSSLSVCPFVQTKQTDHVCNSSAGFGDLGVA